MRRHLLSALLLCFALSSVASATMVRQQWNTGVNGSRQAIIDFLVDLANPQPVPDVEEVIDNAFFLGDNRDNYVAKFYGWVTVPETGTYQFHYWCDDYGMLYVSQDEEMANAVEVAYVEGWTTAREWDKFPSQHSDPMELKKGQIMAVMAFYQEATGDDWMGIGWTGPGLSSDITNPTELTDYITHIPPTPRLAREPVPVNEAVDVVPDVVLGWTAGKFAATHNVYFGTSFDDVNAADAGSPLLVSSGQTATNYEPPGRLDFGQTYYWRIDEVNAAPDFTVDKGKVWSFTVAPLYYAVEDVNATASVPTSAMSGEPEALVDSSGLIDGLHGLGDADMWVSEQTDDPIWLQFDFDRVYKLYGIHVWNYNGQFEFILGFGFKDVTIEYATEPNEWITLGDYELTKAPNQSTYAGQRLDLDGVVARSIRIHVNSTHSGGKQAGLSEIQFLYKPVFAREPQPADGATEVDRAISLSWRPGREAATHQVHLGTDPNAVADGAALVGSATTAVYDPGALALGATYYWKVTEVNEAEVPTTWDSALWSFTVEDYISVDDFESYTADDDAGQAVWQAWLDGYEVASNGSVVGHDMPPYVETEIRKSGSQSMPFYYSNTGAASVSEAELTLAPAADWTAWGIQSLSLHFAGAPGNGGQLYVKINGVKVPYDGPAEALASTVWHPWNIDLAAVGVNLSGVNSLVIGVEGAGASGLLYIDDIRLYPQTPAYIIPEQPSDANLVAHYTFDEGSGTTVSDSSGSGNHGTASGTPEWTTGRIGGAMKFSGDDHVDCGDDASLVIRDAITVACWVKIDAFVTGWETIISMGDDSYRMSRSAETGNSIHFGCNGPTGDNLDGAGDVTTNTWRHAALVYDGVYKIIYIDGIEVSRVASTGQIDESNYNLWIGANEQQSGRNLRGEVDDVRIYSRPLSPAEVAGLADRTEPVAVAF